MKLEPKLWMLLFLAQDCMAVWPFSSSEIEVGADGTLAGGSAGPLSDDSTQSSSQVSVVFTNNSPEAADLYWDDGSYGAIVATQVPAHGGETQINTFVSHKFYWTVHGRRQQLGSDIAVKAGVVRYELSADVSVAVDKSACQDRARRCSIDAKNGECTRNPGWMIVNCPKSCDALKPGTCALLDPKKRCDRTLPHLNMSADPTWKAGDLNAMFEAIMAPDSPWQHLNPTALSRPPEGPWLVQFDNVVEEKEIKALTGTVANQFERSTDTGASNEFGEAQKLMSTGRTSENAWCVNDCYTHPNVVTLTERIQDITHVPHGHYENFQVLRYQPGQYYRTHHDMSPSDMKLPCGPRILTFFLYLSDVEEGGGTNFPRLNSPPGTPQGSGLTVQPKRGRAVLWPSVLDSDPTRQDPRTHHQALPVTKGTKFAANAWIHLFDYKMPNLWGCTGAFG